MLDQVVLVGRIVKQETKYKNLFLTLAVNKPFKNLKGEYETNLIPCLIKGIIADKTQEYCKENDIVGIKGSLENKGNKLYVLVERITFISSKNGEK